MTRQNRIPAGIKFMPNMSITYLRNCYAKEKIPVAKQRILSWIKRKQDKTMEKIGEELGVKETTVCKWLIRVMEDGLASRYNIKRLGRECHLSEKQLEKLTKDLIAGPEKCGYSQSAWSTVMVTDHIWKKFKVQYVPRSVQNLLKRLGFTIQKPRQYHPKAASKSEQERFKKKLGTYWHKERHTEQ